MELYCRSELAEEGNVSRPGMAVRAAGSSLGLAAMLMKFSRRVKCFSHLR